MAPDLSWMDEPDTYADGPDAFCECDDCFVEHELADIFTPVITLISPLLNEVPS